MPAAKNFILDSTKDLARETRQFEMAPGSVNEEDFTVEVVFSTGSRGLRTTWMGERYYEELSMDPKHVNLKRLNQGAPLLNNHRTYDGVEDVPGVVKKAWIENGEGRAIVQFDREDEVSKKIFGKIQRGILKNISVGYEVRKYVELEGKVKGLTVYSAREWEPFEISIVTVPFDKDAQVRKRSKNDEIVTKCEFYRINRNKNEVREGEMPGEDKNSQVTETRGSVENTESKKEVPKEEAKETRSVASDQSDLEEYKKRSARIMRMCERASLKVSEAQKYIDSTRSIEDISEDILNQKFNKENESETDSTRKVEVNSDCSREKERRDGFINCMLHRSLEGQSEQPKLTDAGRHFRGMTFMEMTAEITGATYRANEDEVLKRAFHATSDFPLLLIDTMNKMLQNLYMEAPQSYEPLVKKVSVKDFRQNSVLRQGDVSELKEIKEGGEFENGTFGEGRELISVKSYGRALPVTRQLMINDDVNAIMEVPILFGRRVRSLESKLFWDLFVSNPTLMTDSKQLYHSDHNNTAARADINVTSVAAAWTKFRRQKGLGEDADFIRVNPKYLVVPEALRVQAEQFVSSQYVPDTQNQINPYQGKLEVISDPRLDDDATNKWYLASSATELDCFQQANLRGEGAKTEIKEIFGTGMIMKVLYDVGFSCIDYRGLFRNG